MGWVSSFLLSAPVQGPKKTPVIRPNNDIEIPLLRICPYFTVYILQLQSELVKPHNFTMNWAKSAIQSRLQAASGFHLYVKSVSQGYVAKDPSFKVPMSFSECRDDDAVWYVPAAAVYGNGNANAIVIPAA